MIDATEAIGHVYIYMYIYIYSPFKNDFEPFAVIGETFICSRLYIVLLKCILDVKVCQKAVLCDNSTTHQQSIVLNWHWYESRKKGLL